MYTCHLVTTNSCSQISPSVEWFRTSSSVPHATKLGDLLEDKMDREICYQNAMPISPQVKSTYSHATRCSVVGSSNFWWRSTCTGTDKERYLQVASVLSRDRQCLCGLSETCRRRFLYSMSCSPLPFNLLPSTLFSNYPRRGHDSSDPFGNSVTLYYLRVVPIHFYEDIEYI